MDKEKFDFCPYEVLGLDEPKFPDEGEVNITTAEGPTNKDIRSRYRKLALKYHPDRNRGSKEHLDAIRNKFEKVKLASEILQDANLRSKYDQLLRAKALARQRRHTQDKDRTRFINELLAREKEFKDGLNKAQ
jgi:DnaJ-class molecular chaperone